MIFVQERILLVEDKIIGLEGKEVHRKTAQTLSGLGRNDVGGLMGEMLMAIPYLLYWPYGCCVGKHEADSARKRTRS